MACGPDPQIFACHFFKSWLSNLQLKSFSCNMCRPLMFVYPLRSPMARGLLPHVEARVVPTWCDEPRVARQETSAFTLCRASARESFSASCVKCLKARAGSYSYAHAHVSPHDRLARDGQMRIGPFWSLVYSLIKWGDALGRFCRWWWFPISARVISSSKVLFDYRFRTHGDFLPSASFFKSLTIWLIDWFRDGF